jgi:hypothetical protein
MFANMCTVFRANEKRQKRMAAAIRRIFTNYIAKLKGSLALWRRMN